MTIKVPPTETALTDSSQRFIFEEADVRGETVHLQRAYQDILDLHQYPPGVTKLMGEFLAAAVLLSTNLKFDGKLIVQASSEGQIPLLMAQCNNKLEIRAIAQGAQEATSDDMELLLTNGQLAITIDPDKGQRYQGVVALEGGSLATTLDAYFEQSEQLRTRIWLACDGQRAGGLLLQQLPAQIVEDPKLRAQYWEHVAMLADTSQTEELLDLETAALVHRLYHEESLRLFGPDTVKFACGCSRERSLNALSCLGAEDLTQLLTETDPIIMDCEFCNAQFTFTEDDLSDLLEAPESKTLH
ncbi:MAG: Hsp33 family molecular chaperone HslO [Halioglobus sp.]